MPDAPQIAEESARDAAAVEALHAAAFGRRDEADLVRRLRREVEGALSLVALQDGRPVGHALFTPVAVPQHAELRLVGLGPMAVDPKRQRRGIGSALVHEGLQRCRERGTDAVVVMGHPSYYPRFGFVPAKRYGLRCAWDVPNEAFMVCVLRDGALDGCNGKVLYHPAFDGI